MKASAKDLRFHSKEILDSVERGEEVTITRRGKPKAKIVPLKTKPDEKQKDELFGIWADYVLAEDVTEYIDKLRGSRFQDK